MFTGIVQNLADVISFKNGELEISTSLDLSDCKIGSSICCNGVCLTATEINFREDQYTFKVNVGEETQDRTNFSNQEFNKLAKINIEKSLKIGDEISGHFVYGHIDRTTNITNINTHTIAQNIPAPKFKLFLSKPNGFNKSVKFIILNKYIIYKIN